MCATSAERFRENDNENGRNFAKINYFRMSFENFASPMTSVQVYATVHSTPMPYILIQSGSCGP